MNCKRCEVWELCGVENFCSWCGLSLLRLELRVDRSRISDLEYPPPLMLTVVNLSGERDLHVESVTSTAPWVSLLDPLSVPAIVPQNQQRVFLLDVDTLQTPAAPASGEVLVQVAHADPLSITLQIV